MTDELDLVKDVDKWLYAGIDSLAAGEICGHKVADFNVMIEFQGVSIGQPFLDAEDDMNDIIYFRIKPEILQNNSGKEVNAKAKDIYGGEWLTFFQNEQLVKVRIKL